jgi:hypothetical protein
VGIKMRNGVTTKNSKMGYRLPYKVYWVTKEDYRKQLVGLSGSAFLPQNPQKSADYSSKESVKQWEWKSSGCSGGYRNLELNDAKISLI